MTDDQAKAYVDELMNKLLAAEIRALVDAHREDLVKKVRIKIDNMHLDSQLAQTTEDTHGEKLP